MSKKTIPQRRVERAHDIARRSVDYARPAAAVTIRLSAGEIDALMSMLLDLDDAAFADETRHAAYCKVYAAQELTDRR